MSVDQKKPKQDNLISPQENGTNKLLGNPDTSPASNNKPGCIARGFSWCIRSGQPRLNPYKAALLLLCYSFVLAVIGVILLFENNTVYQTEQEYTNL